jgi:hypothetical protein
MCDLYTGLIRGALKVGHAGFICGRNYLSQLRGFMSLQHQVDQLMQD